MRNARMERWYRHTITTVDAKGKTITTPILMPTPPEPDPNNPDAPIHSEWVAVLGKKKQ